MAVSVTFHFPSQAAAEAYVRVLQSHDPGADWHLYKVPPWSQERVEEAFIAERGERKGWIKLL